MSRDASRIGTDESILRILEAMFDAAIQHPEYELEVRLGKVGSNGSFVPGVTRVHMDELVRSLDLLCAHDPSQMTTPTREWTENETYYFTHSGIPYRTRVDFVDTSRISVVSTTVRKRILQQATVKTKILDARISLASEIVEKHPPPIVHTTHVRIKQTRSFRMRTAPFRIDVSLMWDGTTRVDAERRQMSEDPRMEVECEFVCGDECAKAWMRRNKSRTRMALSLLYKVGDVMMTDGLHFCLCDMH